MTLSTLTESATKHKIFTSARDLFVRKGYDATSIREIASVSEANVAMVNYYFESKYNLFEEVFEDSLEMLTSEVFKIFKADLSIFELIEAWVSTYYEILLKHPEIPIFVLREISQNPERLTTGLKSKKPYEIFLQLSARINEEVEKGTICKTPPLDFLLNVLSLCIFPFMFGQLATNSVSRTNSDYREVLMNHKRYVIDFIKKALKP